jgi:hypothetical protein
VQSYLPRRSPLLSSHLYFSYPVIENFIWIEPLLRGHLSYKATFSLSQRWSLNTGLPVYHGQPVYTSTWRASALNGGWGHLIFLKLIMHMTFSLPQRLNILAIKFKIVDLRSLCNNTANPIICLVWHFTHYAHMWKTLVWPHQWLRKLVEYLQMPAPSQEIDRSCICVMSLRFASVSIIVQVDTHVE